MKLIRLKNNYGNKGLYKGSITPNSRWRFNCKRSTTGKRSIHSHKGLVGEGVLFRVEEGHTTKHCIKVDFDIAVALTQEESTKLEGSIRTSGEGKLNIVPLLSKVGLGVNANGAASRETKDDGQTIHRIRCTIPLSLPDSPNE